MHVWFDADPFVIHYFCIELELHLNGHDWVHQEDFQENDKRASTRKMEKTNQRDQWEISSNFIWCTDFVNNFNFTAKWNIELHLTPKWFISNSIKCFFSFQRKKFHFISSPFCFSFFAVKIPDNTRSVRIVLIWWNWILHWRFSFLTLASACFQFWQTNTDCLHCFEGDWVVGWRVKVRQRKSER